MILIALLQSQTELKDNKECAQTCVLSVLFVSFVCTLIYFKKLTNKKVCIIGTLLFLYEQ